VNQYGLKTVDGWLPRDARRRQCGEKMNGPDLWQDKGRAMEYADIHGAELVEFTVQPVLVDLGEPVCGAV
jgi:hypothetical protein